MDETAPASSDRRMLISSTFFGSPTFGEKPRDIDARPVVNNITNRSFVIFKKLHL
jgi:hypothetical protein